MPTDFGIVLGLAYQGFVDELRADLAARGFTDLGSAYGYVLRAVAAEPLPQRALARRLGITEQGTGKLVAEMTRRKYLRQERDAADARAYRLVLAPRGQALLRAARRFHARFERRLARRVGPASARSLRHVLEQIVASSSDTTAQGRLRPT